MAHIKQLIKKIIPKSIFPFLSSVYFSLRFLYYKTVLAPIKIRKNTTDRKVFNQIFLHKEYDIKLGFEPGFIIDAGANVGFASLYFNRRYPKSIIYAIEPENSNFEVLSYNVKNKKNIICFKGGIWHKKGYLKIKNINDSKWGFITVEVENKESADIETTTIDEILQMSGFKEIDVLKMDIEGAEKEVFLGNFQSWLPKVKILIIETHEHIKSGCEAAVLNAISNFEFDSFTIGENKVFVNKRVYIDYNTRTI
jgi:FkbM family methyltransferase